MVLAGWLVLIGGYQLIAARNGLGPREATERLVDFLTDSAWGPLVYVAVYLARVVILFSAALLTVAAGFLYGPLWGTALVVIAANGSAMLAYSIGRWFAPASVTTEIRTGRAARWVERLRTRGFETTLTLRLLFVPYDLVSYAAGFARLRPITFLTATALGSAPGTVAFVLFGASLDELGGEGPPIDWRLAAASVALFAASLVGVRVLRNRSAGAELDG